MLKRDVIVYDNNNFDNFEELFSARLIRSSNLGVSSLSKPKFCNVFKVFQLMHHETVNRHLANGNCKRRLYVRESMI